MGQLARAAEALGKVEDSKLVVPVLTRLLEHPDPVVQEATIYGLCDHMSPEVRSKLERHASAAATNDIVRDVVAEALGD